VVTTHTGGRYRTIGCQQPHPHAPPGAAATGQGLRLPPCTPPALTRLSVQVAVSAAAAWWACEGRRRGGGASTSTRSYFVQLQGHSQHPTPPVATVHKCRRFHINTSPNNEMGTAATSCELFPYYVSHEHTYPGLSRMRRPGYPSPVPVPAPLPLVYTRPAPGFEPREVALPRPLRPHPKGCGWRGLILRKVCCRCTTFRHSYILNAK
jgi:hypothetical protein